MNVKIIIYKLFGQLLNMRFSTATGSFTSSNTIHDTWTELYLGVRRLIYEIIPPTSQKLTAEERAMCQLALIGANQLMEITLYKILAPYAKESERLARLTSALLDEASYHQMMTKWLPAISGNSLNLGEEPFKSTEKLRKRRNDTIHKTPANTTTEMVRSAIFSSVEGSKALYHFSGNPFPYCDWLERYPQQIEQPFSSIVFPYSSSVGHL